MTTTSGIRTDAEIRALTCPPAAAFVEAAIRDPRLPGFTLRAYASGRKVFFLLYRFNREKKRLKIGIYCPPKFGLAAARIEASAKLASITLGANPAGTVEDARRAQDVRALYAQFEREVVKRFPPKTRSNWNCTSRRFLREIGSLPITATDEICDRLMALHKRIGFDEEKEALAHTVFKHACRFFRWAVNERKLKPTQFPLAGLRSRFRDKKRTRYYDPDEVRRLLLATRDVRTWWPEDVAPENVTEKDRRWATLHRGYFRLLWYIGCRRGALASMRWTEIKPDHVTAGTWLWYRPTSKNSDPLEIPLSSYAIQVLDELRPLTERTGFVFPSQRSDGKTGYRSDSWKPVDRLRRASGVSDFANHAVRKTISTYLTRVLDISNDVVTAILNHRLSGPKANENYIHALPVRRMRAALETWGRHLGTLGPAEEGRLAESGIARTETTSSERHISKRAAAS